MSNEFRYSDSDSEFHKEQEDDITSISNDSNEVISAESSSLSCSEDIISHKNENTSKNRKRSKKNKSSINSNKHPEILLKGCLKKIKYFTKEKKNSEILKELIRITALTRIIYGPKHWKVAEAHISLANGYLNFKDFAAQAYYHADIAKNILLSGIQITNNDSTDRANILNVLLSTYYMLGKSLTLLKKYSQAEHMFLKSEKVAQQKSKHVSANEDEIHDWEVKNNLALARVAALQHNSAVSKAYFQKTLDLLESVHGSEHVGLIAVYQGLGQVEQDLGDNADHEKAIEYFLQAHSIALSIYKADSSIEVAETAHCVARAYSCVGSLDAEISAESYLNECLAIYQLTCGPSDHRSINIQEELARLMIRTDRHMEALKLLKSILKNKQQTYGEFGDQVLTTLKLIGSTYLAIGDLENALKYFKKSLSIETLNHSSKHHRVKEIQKTIDIILANPSLSSKQKNTPSSVIRDRPRFQ